MCIRDRVWEKGFSRGLLCADAEFRDVGGQRGQLGFEPFRIGIYRVDKLIQDLPGRRKLKFAVVVFVEFGLVISLQIFQMVGNGGLSDVCLLYTSRCV